MRLATTISVTLIALSSAALAQVATPPIPGPANNTMADSAITPDPAASTSDTVVDGVDNMLSQSAAPPPAEPK